MDFQANHWRLCRLIDDSLRPYAELDHSSLTPQVVKNVLISLSQATLITSLSHSVYRRIQDWTLEFSSDSENEMARKPADNTEGSHVLESNPNGHKCMAKIIEHLMSLIGLKDQYIQHLVCNTLLAISEFLILSETGYDELIHFLCYCLKITLHNPFSSSPWHLVMEPNSDFDSLDSILSLKLKLENADCITAGAIIWVLRNVLKLKLKDKLLEVYLHYVTDAISNLPWDLLYEAYDDASNSKSLVRSDRDAAQLKSFAIFHGRLLQFFSSLVGINGHGEAETVSYKYQAVYEIRSCVPRILAGCIGKLKFLDNVQISKYLRHKMLMLMMKLSFAIDMEHSILISWMHLINKYFQDLLSQPIEVVQSDQDDCLEGSPFWSDELNEEKQRISSCHLQRLAIFLFLKCSFTLLSVKGRHDEELGLASSDSFLVFDLNLQNSSNEGQLELQKWLQKHVPGDMFLDDEAYSASCTNFALYFLQLYMHEDDILFEMLLQIFCLPSYSRAARGGISAAKNDVISLVSDLFNPIGLFRLFLKEIHYDHQVLLDYLISKDIGDRCAEYLLRCLRLVCDSWTVFLEIPACQKSSTPLPPKRRNVLVKGLRTGSKYSRPKRFSFEDAKDCLLLLKASIKSLHQKKLFPYNPRVLLQRLTRFEELCVKQVDMDSIT